MTDLLCRFSQMPVAEIVSFSKDQNNEGLEVMVATLFIKAINTGDHARLGFILDRLIGKVKESIEHAFIGNLNTAIVDKIEEIEKANRTGGNNGEKSISKISEEERLRTEERNAQTDGQKVGSKEKIGSEDPF